MELHPLLQRQLRRIGLDSAVGGQLAELLQRVSQAYQEHDQDRYLLERSQDLASQEMAALYTALRTDRDQLDRRVRDRTEALQLSEARLSSLVSLSADWIWEQDTQQRYTYLSESCEAVVGSVPSQWLGKHKLDKLKVEAAPEVVAAYRTALEARQPFRDLPYSFERPDGSRRHVLVSGEPVFDDGGNFQGYRGVGRDVTDARRAEQQVHDLARFDSLTGLPNRNMFLAELDRAIARARRHGTPFAVCFIDLDRFKTVNDSLGHDAGDELLKAMANRLKSALRQNDLVARLGGDEFVVLLEGSTGSSDLMHAAEKMLTVVGEPLGIQSCSFLITGSIGIAVYPDDGVDAASLLKAADSAMYLAKDRGKNQVQFYTAELADKAARDFELESALRLALVRDELRLHYQPKTCVATGAIVGMEALARWMHPRRGLVSPAEFIPLAEERGLIVPIGRWVVQAACRQIRDWRNAGLLVPPVAVNLSARQFVSDTLISDIATAMKVYGVEAADLAVELTESVLMADPERANTVLQQLHTMGLHIAIDDFGTGYSSLSYLKRFPAQTVKIDRSFISGLPQDSDDAAITGAVIAMAHSLGLNVVAEGVEHPAQLAALQRMGCDQAQGYLMGRPMPAADLAHRLQAEGEQPRRAA